MARVKVGDRYGNKREPLLSPLRRVVKEKDEGKMALSISGGINSPWIVDLNKLNKKLLDILLINI